jgi:hypothetical protein
MRNSEVERGREKGENERVRRWEDERRIQGRCGAERIGSSQSTKSTQST